MPTSKIRPRSIGFTEKQREFFKKYPDYNIQVACRSKIDEDMKLLQPGELILVANKDGTMGTIEVEDKTPNCQLPENIKDEPCEDGDCTCEKELI